MAKRTFGNLLGLAVLSCLTERPMHPYEISQTLRFRGKDQSIKLNYGSLYAVVDSLADAGLIRAKETVRDGRRPERTVYEITDAGREKHDGWLSSLISTPVREYHSLEAGLALLGGLAPDDVPRLLDERIMKLRLELATAEESMRIAEEMNVPELFVLEGQFRIAMLHTDLDFCKGLAQRIRTDDIEGLVSWRGVHRLLAEGMTFDEIMRDPIGLLGEDGAALAALPAEPG